MTDRAVMARHRSDCGLCPEPIYPDEMIVKIPGQGWVHEVCGERAGYLDEPEGDEAPEVRSLVEGEL